MVHFQEYWVRLRAAVPAETVLAVGQDAATPAPGVLEAIGEADLVVLPPSNPVVSVGTILGRARHPRRRPLDLRPRSSASPPSSAAPTCAAWRRRCSPASASRSAPARVGPHYGARAAGGVLDGWLVDERDAGQLAGLEAAGIRAAAVPLMMSDHDATAAMAAAAVSLVTPGPA